MWVKAPLDRLVLLPLPGALEADRVLSLHVQWVAVTALGSRGQCRAEAEAVAQGAPVLLTLEPHAPGDGLLHLLSTGQEDVHQLHIWPGGQREM